MLDRIRSRLAVTMCFLFGHVYYQRQFTGKFTYIGVRFPMVVPLMERTKPEYCIRCGKSLKPKIKPKKGDKNPVL